MNKSIWLTLLLICFWAAPIYAQTGDGETVEGGEKDSALVAAEGDIARAEETGHAAGLADAAHRAGKIHFRLQHFDRAHHFYDRALAAYEALDDRHGVGNTLKDIGSTYYGQGAYDQARAFYRRALAAYEAIDDRQGIGKARNNIGVTHRAQGSYDQALALHLQALAVYETIDDQRGIGSALRNIGIVHGLLGNGEEGLRFSLRALAVFEKLKDRHQAAYLLNNIGTEYKNKGDYDKALGYYVRALKIYEEEGGDKRSTGIALSSIGDIHYKRGDLAQARAFLLDAGKIFEAIGDQSKLAGVLMRVARVYRAEGAPDQALVAAERALALAQEAGAQKVVRNSYEILAGLHEKGGRFEEALAAHKGYKATHDSLFNAESQATIAKLQTLYRTKEQQQQNELLEHRLQTQKTRLGASLGGFVLLFLIAFLVNNRYRLKNRANQALAEAATAQAREAEAQARALQAENRRKEIELEKARETALLVEQLKRSNEELEQFASVASHDLQEPLRTINSFVGLLQKRYEGQLGEDADTFIGYIVDGSNRMLALIRDLLAFSRVGRQEVEHRPVNVCAVLQQTLSGIQTALDEADAEVTIDPMPTVEGDARQLGQVFQNLISNAVKFRGEAPPRVHISALREEAFWRFSVKDNGIGIKEKYQQKIFEIFQRLHSRSKYEGTGIGLATCKKIVERHGGRIWVESEEGRGTTFFFTIPA